MSAPQTSDITSSTLYGWDIERDPSECIGLLQKPGCGTKPTDAGERGGSLQLATFAVLIVGLAIIFTVVFRNVLRADRRKAAEVTDPASRWSKTDTANRDSAP
ncbi:MAG: hypothetical protein ACKOYL_02905 [Actinomycetota bacterium]